MSILLGFINSVLGVFCLNSFDVVFFFVVLIGIVVVYVVGNLGLYLFIMNFYGLWIIFVGVSISDRIYENYVIIRNNYDYIGMGFFGKRVRN